MPITHPPKNRLLHTWNVGDQKFRLIVGARYTPGYEDFYLVESCSEGSLGEDRWTPEATFDADSSDVRSLLVQALRQVLP